MSKKLAVYGVVMILCMAVFFLVSGCDDKATAGGEKEGSDCQVKATTECSKTAESTCGTKDKSLACTTDYKKECCTAQQKAGTCPLQSDKASCPKICPKKAEACENKS